MSLALKLVVKWQDGEAGLRGGGGRGAGWVRGGVWIPRHGTSEGTSLHGGAGGRGRPTFSRVLYFPYMLCYSYIIKVIYAHCKKILFLMYI